MFEWTIILGAFLGGSVRYVTGIIFTRVFSQSEYPFPIFIINLIGSFLLGLVSFFLNQNTTMYLLLITGFLGAFTTYSTFSIESVQLWKQKKYKIFILYVTSTLIGSIIFCALGVYLAIFLL